MYMGEILVCHLGIHCRIDHLSFVIAGGSFNVVIRSKLILNWNLAKSRSYEMSISNVKSHGHALLKISKRFGNSEIYILRRFRDIFV